MPNIHWPAMDAPHSSVFEPNHEYFDESIEMPIDGK